MKRKGFTLIELLAVIIILAVIALIATPIILNVVDSAKKSAFESSAYGIVDTIKLDYQEGILSGDNVAKTYDFSTTTDIDNKYSGEKPQGIAKVDEDGRIEMAVHNGKWCAIKGLNEGTITILDYDAETCVLEESTTETTGYEAGDYVTVQLASGITKNFYVLSVDGSNVTLILDRNLGDDIAWASSDAISAQETAKGVDIDSMTEAELYAFLTELGPVTAETQLPTTWSNASEVRLPNAEELVAQTAWYQGLTDTENWENEYVAYLDTIFADETFNTALNACSTNECFRAAFTDYEERTGEDSILVPTWLDINLYASGDSTQDNNGNYKFGYWTEDIVSANPDGAWGVNCVGFVYDFDVDNSDGIGVRPVITINESHIVAELDAPIYVDDEVTTS